MTVITRFAPSPTGYLHIGGARTALFNYLFAKHHGGKYLLRIEDTDRERSTKEAVDAIHEGLNWLGLTCDEEAIHQYERAAHHKAIAEQLLESGHAYHCYCSQEELAEMREQAKAEKRGFKYDGRWRDRDPSEAPEGVDPVIRLKAPQEGETVIEDLVQGRVVVQNSELDDMILLRSDGTPTYMLAVVVDDHDMGITHVIRGDDHLTNASRQVLIYQALGWEVPSFAHIPLIHGADGAKLSKRHGALGAEAYRDMGYLPEAMCNYLLRLGWSHGDEEIISRDQSVEWFDLDHVGKSPARFDMQKLDHINGHYIREADNQRLFELVLPLVEDKVGEISEEKKAYLQKGVAGLKQRAKTLLELAESGLFYVQDAPLPLTEKAEKALDADGKTLIQTIHDLLQGQEVWEEETLYLAVQKYAEENDLKLGKVAAPLRAALTGSHVSPSVFEMFEVFGKEESLKRLLAVSS